MPDIFPKTLIEAVRHFADTDSCYARMVRLKWPNGHIVCPKCGADKIGEIASRRLLQCKACRKQFSAKVGTIFEDSPLPLSSWFVAVWCIANGGVRSPALARAIEVTQKTAWKMLMRIKLAMQTNTCLEAAQMDEIEYRIVPDFPAYRIGSDGSLWTCWRKGPGAIRATKIIIASGQQRWKQMRPRLDDEGYRSVELCGLDGSRLHCKLGQIVLRAFVGPPPDGQECRHLDGNEANDSLGNLCWGTPLENHADKRRHGTIATSSRHGRVKLTDEQIAELLALKGTMIQQEAADRFGVARGYVGQLWSGQRKRVTVP